MHLYAYKNGSASAKALCAALNIKKARHEGRRLVSDVVVNWGSSGFTRDVYCDVLLNHPDAVAKAVNKLESFKAWEGSEVAVPFTTSIDEAAEWLNEGSDVVVRHKLSGHSGEGIEIVDKGEGPGGLTAAPLYTKYIKKDQEYRIHVFAGEIIFQQRKARSRVVPDEQVNWKIRNHGNGFVFANRDVRAPENVLDVCRRAVAALGLDFGACDVLTTKQGEAYVLEVNTSPGLEGSTLDAYVGALKKYL